MAQSRDRVGDAVGVGKGLDRDLEADRDKDLLRETAAPNDALAVSEGTAGSDGLDVRPIDGVAEDTPMARSSASKRDRGCELKLHRWRSHAKTFVPNLSRAAAVPTLANTEDVARLRQVDETVLLKMVLEGMLALPTSTPLRKQRTPSAYCAITCTGAYSSSKSVTSKYILK